MTGYHGQPIGKVCCEKGCDKPVDRPRSRVRCAEHFTPPKYGGASANGKGPRPTK